MIRSASVPNGRPNVSISDRLSLSPAPIPTNRREPAMRTTVSSPAASCCRRAQGRARTTSVPTEIRSVSAATAPSNARHSSAGRISPDGAVRNR